MVLNLKPQVTRGIDVIYIEFPGPVMFKERPRAKITTTKCKSCLGKKCQKCKWRGTRMFSKFYNTPRVEAWENAIRMVAPRCEPFWEGPISIDLMVCFPQKKNLKIHNGITPYLHKPDADNIAKIWKDALEGRVYKNDLQVWRLRVIKRYHPSKNEKEIMTFVTIDLMKE